MSELRKTVAKDVWCDTSENLSNLFNKFGKIMDWKYDFPTFGGFL